MRRPSLLPVSPTSRPVSTLVVGLLLAAAVGSLPAFAVEVPFAHPPADVGNLFDPRSITAADLDGDGDLDLVPADRTPFDVHWYENTAGDGSAWTAHLLSDLGTGLFDVAAADVDGDGDLDLVASAAHEHTLAWWENTAGDGSAWSRQVILGDTPDPGAFGEVAVADFDRDGDLDVACSNTVDATVRWHENTAGDGSAWTSHTITMLAGRFGRLELEAADLDGDGDPDLLLDVFDELQWLENIDTGAAMNPWALRPVHFPIPVIIRAVSAADVDGDGDLDAIAGVDDAQGLRWYELTGDKLANWTVHEIAADHVKWVDAADLDLDGDQDLLAVVTTEDSGRQAFWYENTAGDGSAWTPRAVTDAPDGSSSVDVADLDGDGDLDLMTFPPEGTSVARHRNETLHRSAVFTEGEPLAPANAGGVSEDFAVGDFDGDGDLDTAFGEYLPGSTPVSWYENTGGDAASWIPHQVTASIADPARIGAADVDGDGDLDLLASSLTDFTLAWYENVAADGTSWTANPVATATARFDSLGVADFDRDGDLDLAATVDSASGDLRWYENTAGDGSAWTQHAIAGAEDGRAVPGDVDGDGDPDVVLGGADLHWFENDGSGSGWTVHQVPATFSTESPIPADVDGDGDLDVVGSLRWHENTAGDGSAWSERPVGFGFLEAGFAADLDGDGDTDLLARFNGRWFENGTGDGSAWVTHTIPLFPGYPRAVGDLDGDGWTDYLSWSDSDFRPRAVLHRGGQLALATTDVAQKVVRDSLSLPLLEIDGLHRGRTGDGPAEVSRLGFRFADGAGAALDGSQASALFDGLSVWADDGSGRWEPGADTAVGSVAPVVPDGEGVVAVTLLDDVPALRATLGSPATLFLVGETSSVATSQGPPAFEVIHRAYEEGGGEDADHDIPLVLELADDVSTGVVSTTVDSSTCRSPAELALTDVTVASALVCEAGTRLAAGDGVEVTAGGDLTLRAGEGVALGDGFAAGGILRIEIDPALLP